MKRNVAKLGLFLCALIGVFHQSFGQLRQLSVNRSDYVSQKQQNINSRVLADTLELPFWDDFSQGTLDSTKWESNGANVSLSVGEGAPSLGVLLLDGTKANGQPYSTDIGQVDVTDQLTSRPIDLSGIADEEQNSLYLSFFWQAGGKAEMPDSNDYLQLQFLDSLGNWNEIWTQYGGASMLDFQQEMIPLDGIYLHGQFKMKFLSSGRLAGPFDSWLLDYIYLNKNRTADDQNYPDRALTQLNSSFLGNYTALPLYEFNALSDTVLTSINNQFYNLNDRFRAMEYSAEIRDESSQESFMVLNSNTPFNPVPLANERRDFASGVPSELAQQAREEAFDLESIVYLSSGDDFLIDEITDGDTTYFSEVDFRINDTARTTIPIRDYYAFDRGTVDYAAGINQRSGMVAVKYHSSSPAYVNALSINFTNPAQAGTAVDLLVWHSLEEQPVYAKEVIIQPKDSLNQITQFSLDTAIQVEGDFYVGYMQFTNDFIHIGLDKSNDSSSEVHYNISGSWAPSDQVIGSLMIRAHMQTEAPLPPEVPEAASLIKAYPNPVENNKIFLEGDVEDVKLYDTFGREIKIDISEAENGKFVNFTTNRKGVYLIKAWNKNSPQLIRILVK
ncbi:T9SS C-terminal target domain-containing protein [Echinicola strongylocentroti]|uniref:T9SS C-terminal target domain-containing protein n=1 Tax=Echinicola strongylocentroti TaxID=1795355 RepID=A0A2Z4IEN5_9BACT|nr:T9SS type A sorting domain-containing protein [Echinicola strongylocentroti]AWW28903.1 T9SS C-terminal target domain-containing protein [Echinicola strongylocentroti]